MNELIAACKEGRADVVQELLEKFEPSQRDDKGWSPLHYASQYGHKEIVELLLQRGCLPQIETRDRDKKSDTPLHLASVNGHEDVVRCLLEALPVGEPLRRNKEGNNPLHLACKVGNTSIVHVLREYSPSAAYEANYHSVTPFGFALSNSHLEIANLLLEHAKGNPAVRFKDFATQFPSFEPKRSLDFPVKVFVVGDHRSAKSTLIKSLQVEGIWDQVSWNVQNVDQHKAGLVPSDFSSSSFGRVIFYDLAGGPDFIHEDMIQSADDIMHSAFIICINLKEERKEMESRMLYWMNFIYKQCTSYCDPQNKPNVAIVGTFGDVVKPFRLVNAHRLHLSYNSVIASHPEVSAQFDLLRKYYILDCRKSQSPSMDQLRSALKKLCQKVRPKAVEIPSRCYVLSSVLATEVADTSAIQLWELAAKISSTASKDKKALCNLLPQTAEELLPLCKLLQLQCRVTLLNRSRDHNIRSTWVIHRSHRLITIVNNALSAAKESSETSSSPALIKGESLREYFSSISLDFDLLLHLLEHFKIYDSTVRVASSSGEDDRQLFYLPSLLPRKCPLKSWDPNKSSYSFQFAWALVPTAGQECQFFMPRFLKLLLLSLLSVKADYSFIASSNGIFCHQDEIEFCLMVKSEAIILSMRCKHDNEVPCLQLRNQILNDIRAHKERLQPATKTSEYVISMEGAKFPLKKLSKSAQMSFPISDLKSIVTKNVATGSPDPDVQAMLFVEPYFHLSMLSEPYRTILSDPENVPKSVSSEFMAAVAKCFGEKWQSIMEHLDLASDTSTHGSHSHSSEESLEKTNLGYGEFLEQLGSISIFATDLQKALQEIKLSPDSPPLVPTMFYGPHLSPAIKHSPGGSLSSDGGPGTPRAETRHHNFQMGQQPPSSEGSSRSSSELLQVHPDARKCKEISASEPSIVSYTSSEMAYPECTKALRVCAQIRPKRHKFLCQVSCVDMIKVFQCNHTGGVHHSEVHQLEINIPEGAVSENTSVHLEIGVTLHGPFEFPEDMNPISPIIWLSVQEGIAFYKSAEVTLPHFINCTEEISQNVSFLAAEVKKQGGKFQFQKIRNPGACILADSGTLLTKLSCPHFICIAAKTKEMISRTNYCLIEAVPKAITQRVWKAHFCVTYMLPTCTEIATRQLAKDGYSAEIIRAFTFEDTGNPNPAIEAYFRWQQQGNWFLTPKSSRKIKAHEIEFSSVDQAQLRTKVWYSLYPPRFTIEVNGERAVNDACAEISFSGMKEPIQVKLFLPKIHPLIPPSQDLFAPWGGRVGGTVSLGSIASKESIWSSYDSEPELYVRHYQRRDSDSGVSTASSTSHISGTSHLLVPAGSVAQQHGRSVSQSSIGSVGSFGSQHSLTGSYSGRSDISASPGSPNAPVNSDPWSSRRMPKRSMGNAPPELLVEDEIPLEDDEYGHMRRMDHPLESNLVMLTQSLNMDLIRPYLRQNKVITEQEHVRLLEIARDATLSGKHRSADVEHLVNMINRKHSIGFKRFISALEKTAEQDQGHQEILDALRWTRGSQYDELTDDPALTGSQYVPFSDLENSTRKPEERVGKTREELLPSFSQSTCDQQNATNKEDQTEVSNSTFVLQQAADEPRSDIPRSDIPACNYTKPEYEEAQTTDDLGTSFPTLQLSRDPSVPDPSSHQSENSSHQLLPSTLPDEFTTSIAHEPETHASVSYQVPSHQLQVVRNYTTCSKFVPPVPFVDTMEVLVCDNSGGEFNNEAHDITFRIPEGAIPEGLTMTIEIGVALHGPFNFPANLRPISPILWLCPQQDIPLQKPFEVILPHFLSIPNEEDLKHLGLCFMKAIHTDTTMGRYNFEVVIENYQSQTKFSRKNGSNFGHLATKHFCFLCIGAKQNREVARSIGYCLSHIYPEPWPSMPSPPPFYIYFCVTYFLKTCIRTLKRQFPGGFKITAHRPFTFSIPADDSEPQIKICFDRLLPEGWVMALEREGQISPTEVDCWRINEQKLEVMVETNAYPPRFMLSINGSSATGSIYAKVMFLGSKEELITEVSLPYFPPAGHMRRSSSGYESSLEQWPQRPCESSEDDPQCGPSMPDLLNKVAAQIPTKCRQMGIQLGLTSAQLDIMERQYQYDPSRCFEAVFQKWKDTFPEENSWETIIEALKAPIIENNHLAEILKKEFH